MHNLLHKHRQVLHFLAYRREAAFKKTPSLGDGQRFYTCQILQKIVNGPMSGKDGFLKTSFPQQGKKCSTRYNNYGSSQR